MIGVMKAWFNKYLPESGVITLEDLSDATSIFALQGPASEAILSEVLGDKNVVAPFRAQAIEDNEMWLNFKQRSRKGTVSKTFNTTPRADAQSIILHRPVTKERIACINLDFQTSTLD